MVKRQKTPSFGIDDDSLESVRINLENDWSVFGDLGQLEWGSEKEGARWIYFIQKGESGAIKIGISKDPERRLMTLQTASDEPLRIIGCFRGFESDERNLHARFAAQRRMGEWFDPVIELKAVIEELCESNGID